MATGANPAQGERLPAASALGRRRARLVAGIAHGAAQARLHLRRRRRSLMRADSVARLTVASCTPGTFFSARSTRADAGRAGHAADAEVERRGGFRTGSWCEA
jgi:hypothetical protein